ncbi:NAD(P)H-dependent oxidoreductase [Streptococcus dentiloxodontae]
MKTLVIIAHPDIEQAKVNKRWKQELQKYPQDIVIHDLYQTYPDWAIDVSVEQRLLEQHDRIIFQFPIYWYSYPPLLKKWFDDVFTHGWAYGSKGKKLVGKKLGLAMSIGDKKENYTESGGVGFTVDEITVPFKAAANHVGANLLPYFAVFGISFEATDKDIAASAEDYIAHLYGRS